MVKKVGGLNASSMLLRNTADSQQATFTAPAALAASYSIELLDTLPGATEQLFIDNTGKLTTAAASGGTVTSVGIDTTGAAELAVTNSPVTTNGNINLAWVNTIAANTVFAGPDGAAGTPTFRGLLFNDISSLVGTAANTIAAGNDTRLHTQNTDTGTDQTGFIVDSGNTGPQIRNAAGVLQVRDNTNANDADLTAANITASGNLQVTGNLTVDGTTSTVNSTTLTVADPIVTLGQGGLATQVAGIEVGTSNAQLRFNGGAGVTRWQVSADGTTFFDIARTASNTFNNGDLTAGVLTITHGLGIQTGNVIIRTDANEVIEPDLITATSATVTTVDLSTLGVAAANWTWEITV